MIENKIGKSIMDSTIQAHRNTESGLLKTVFETFLAHKLRQQGSKVGRQVASPIQWIPNEE